LPALARDLRVHHDEQHHVAEFLAQIFVIAVAHCVADLVASSSSFGSNVSLV
jgi:hypothetical protein